MVASGYFFVESRMFIKIVGRLLCLSSSLEVLQSNVDARHPIRSVEGNAADVLALRSPKKPEETSLPGLSKPLYKYVEQVCRKKELSLCLSADGGLVGAAVVELDNVDADGHGEAACLAS